MISRRTLHPFQICTLLKLQNPSQYLKNPPHIDRTISQIKSTFSHEFFIPISIFRRPISFSSQFDHKFNFKSVSSDNIHERNEKTRKPLDVLFKEAVGLSPKLEEIESESESENDTMELKKKLRKLEMEVRNLNATKNKEKEKKETRVSKPGRLSAFNVKNSEKSSKREERETKVSKPGSLSAFFVKKSEKRSKREERETRVSKRGSLRAHVVKNNGKGSKREEEEMVNKDLSPDMTLFTDHLYRRGYFENANFLKRNRFDVTCFEGTYARDFIKCAVEKFAKENQQITQWLSSSDLTTVAQFGCPSLGRRTIFSAKALRVIFKIKEDSVCSKCVLNKKCKFVNQSVMKSGARNLDLAVILRVITSYALELVPPELVVPEEVKKSVSQLLKDIQYQSQNVG